jgi:DNA-3-methyladenine glycosylase II
MDDPARERARRHLMRRDPVIGAVVRAAGACRMRRRASAYAFLVRSVLYQQLAGSAARAIERRFHAHFGGGVPPAAVLAQASPVALRRLGLSRQKTAAVRAIGEAFRDGHVRPARFAWMTDEEVIADVTTIRGVGEWTAHMLLMSCLERPDVLPFGDYGVRKGTRDLYGLPELPDRAALEAIAESWAPYRSVASWYLWRATETVVPGA